MGDVGEALGVGCVLYSYVYGYGWVGGSEVWELIGYGICYLYVFEVEEFGTWAVCGQVESYVKVGGVGYGIPGDGDLVAGVARYSQLWWFEF